ncbi:MAG: hypothetical protein HOH38_07635 [Nitrospinaceae bacterium]|nr:hypothetical protein [Nitrospinaceae bacterium]
MRKANELDSRTHRKNLLSIKQLVIHPRKNKYLKMMRQKEIDAMVEFTRNQLMDHYDG